MIEGSVAGTADFSVFARRDDGGHALALRLGHEDVGVVTAVGDEVLAVPVHVCPTSALHKFAYVIEAGKLAGTWEIVGRDRMLTV